MVVWEHDDEGHRLAAHDEAVENACRAEADPLIGGVGLSVQKVEDGVAFVGAFIVARGQVNDELLRRIGGFEN